MLCQCNICFTRLYFCCLNYPKVILGVLFFAEIALFCPLLDILRQKPPMSPGELATLRLVRLAIFRDFR